MYVFRPLLRGMAQSRKVENRKKDQIESVNIYNQEF